MIAGFSRRCASLVAVVFALLAGSAPRGSAALPRMPPTRPAVYSLRGGGQPRPNSIADSDLEQRVGWAPQELTAAASAPPAGAAGTAARAAPRYRSLGRTWWGAREYELQRRNGEDLSVESLREAWNFPPADCLTFRHRVPDRWGDVPLAPGLLGAIEALCELIPGIHSLLYIYRGLWPCAVCRLPRSTHPLQTLGEAERAFWEAMRDRDTQLAVRLVRGGVACPPDSENHELVAFLIGNYCEDSFDGVVERSRDLPPDANLTQHLTSTTPTTRSWFGLLTNIPYL